MTQNYWIGVVSKEHVKIGVENSIAMVCHGKEGPLKRMKKDDILIYYSPKTYYNKPEVCQQFTAMCRMVDDNIYQFDMGGGFVPYRRNVQYLDCRETPIKPLIEDLSFIQDKSRWGYMFRFGLVKIPKEDFKLIAEKMLSEKELLSLTS